MLPEAVWNEAGKVCRAGIDSCHLLSDSRKDTYITYNKPHDRVNNALTWGLSNDNYITFECQSHSMYTAITSHFMSIIFYLQDCIIKSFLKRVTDLTMKS